eukprot:TRINITY_DN12751_c0_g1_i2.p4 TRINITY_DN12751_c0_g1~~TRINITY_DN12751_c0_g1_i2.p4  ORF type:complete len:54 (+),score=15.69 TRINITY_DN12751_c0_g1_i2:86-247(+)
MHQRLQHHIPGGFVYGVDGEVVVGVVSNDGGDALYEECTGVDESSEEEEKTST